MVNKVTWWLGLFKFSKITRATLKKLQKTAELCLQFPLFLPVAPSNQCCYLQNLPCNFLLVSTAPGHVGGAK